MSSVIVQSGGGGGGGMSPLARIIVDGVSLLAAYGINFIACDFMYHNWNLSQSLKGSYWFFLGPILYIFGPGLSWVEAWIRTIIAKEKGKVKEKLEEWWKSVDPLGLLVVPKNVFSKTLLEDGAIEQQRANIEYLREIGRLT